MAFIMPNISRRQLDWIILFSVDLGVPATLAWQRHTGAVTVSVAVITAIIVLAALNGFLVLNFYRRNKRQALPTGRSFFFGAGVMAIISLLVTVLAVSQIPAHNDYLRLALSNTPLENIHPLRDRLVVELIRSRAANSRENDSLIAEVSKNPLSPQLYTPESFANLEVTQRTSSGLKKFVDADLDYGAKQIQAMTDFRAKMKEADPEYLISWDAKKNDQDTLMAETLKVEKQFLDSVIALYDFAGKHTADIRVSGGKVEISDPKIRQNFESQLSASKNLRDKMTELGQHAAKKQQEARSKSADIVP
jgi:hypothetical protein